MVAAVAPFIDTAISQDGQRAGGLSVRRLPGPLPAGLEGGPEGPGHLPAERGAGRGAAASTRPSPRRPQPLTSDGANRRLALERLPAPVLASLRWPGRPDAAGRQPGVDLHDRAPARRLRAVRRRAAAEAGRGPCAQPAVRGLGQRRRAAARPGALAKTLSMDMRANDPRGCKLKLDALATVAEERAVRDAVPAARREAPVPRRGRGHRGGDPLALRAARRARRRAARRRCSTRCSAARSRGPAPSGTLAWAVDVANPATGEALHLTLKEVHAARRATAAP